MNSASGNKSAQVTSGLFAQIKCIQYEQIYCHALSRWILSLTGGLHLTQSSHRRLCTGTSTAQLAMNRDLGLTTVKKYTRIRLGDAMTARQLTGDARYALGLTKCNVPFS